MNFKVKPRCNIKQGEIHHPWAKKNSIIFESTKTYDASIEKTPAGQDIYYVISNGFRCEMFPYRFEYYFMNITEHRDRIIEEILN